MFYSSGFGINTSSFTERILEHCVACIVINILYYCAMYVYCFHVAELYYIIIIVYAWNKMHAATMHDY